MNKCCCLDSRSSQPSSQKEDIFGKNLTKVNFKEVWSMFEAMLLKCLVTEGSESSLDLAFKNRPHILSKAPPFRVSLSCLPLAFTQTLVVLVMYSCFLTLEPPLAPHSMVRCGNSHLIGIILSSLAISVLNLGNLLSMWVFLWWVFCKPRNVMSTSQIMVKWWGYPRIGQTLPAVTEIYGKLRIFRVFRKLGDPKFDLYIKRVLSVWIQNIWWCG